MNIRSIRFQFINFEESKLKILIDSKSKPTDSA